MYQSVEHWMRYFLIAIGGLMMLMFAVRFVLFKIHESPKYLMGKGDDEGAVRIVHEVARINGKSSNLSVEDLKACELESYAPQTGVSSAAKRHLKEVTFGRIRALFQTKRLTWSTGLIMLVWALLRLAYPLYNAFLPYI